MHLQARRLALGFGIGVVATVAMSAVMLVGYSTGTAPMPRPIPQALVVTIFGKGAMPAVIAGALASHFFYGALQEAPSLPSSGG